MSIGPDLELQHLVERYRALVAATGGIVWTNSPQGEMRGPQPHWCAFTGQSEEEAAGYGWADAVHPDEAQSTIAAWRRAVSSRTMFSFEHRLRRHDGVYRWFAIRAMPVLEYDGAIREWVGLHRDIDDEKRAEHELRQALEGVAGSENRFRALAEQLPNLVFTCAADGRVEYASEQFLKYTGLDLARMAAGDWTATVHPEDRALIDVAWADAMARGVPYEQELRQGPITGTSGYRWFMVRANPVRDEAGRISKWIGSLTDIEAAKQLRDEHARREREREMLLARERTSRERLQAALDGSGAGTFRWNIVNNELEWDENLDRLFGLEAGASVRSLDKFIAMVHPDDRSGVIERCQRCASDGADFDMEFRVVWPDGSLRWLDDKGKTYFDAAGRPAYMTGMCRDVTERKEIEGALRDALARLRTSEEALRESDRRKDEFLATLAHELRNPLAPIRNGMELIKRGGVVDEHRLARVQSTVERQLRHMVRLVDDLLDVSRISRGKIELSRQRLTLDQLFDHAIETSRPVIDGGQHNLSVTLPANPVWLDGDITRLAQSVSNLLNNASKYTPNCGRIQLIGDVDHGQAVIHVADNGVGIAAEHVPLLFDMFSQGANARERGQGGLGIGLALVRKLVEMHDGTVEAASDGPNRGSTFTIRLPLAARVDEPMPPPARPCATVSRRVLVVDDNVDNADTLTMLLEVEGHEPSAAHDGASAMEAIRRLQPDVVLLDIGMPGMDGYEVARAVRADATICQPVLVAMTGWGSESDRRRSSEAGFDLHLTKPVAVEVVADLLSRTPAIAARRRSGGFGDGQR